MPIVRNPKDVTTVMTLEKNRPDEFVVLHYTTVDVVAE